MSSPAAVLAELPATATPDEAIRALGFDPETVRAVVVTPTTAIAVAVDYPEPHISPEEAS